MSYPWIWPSPTLTLDYLGPPWTTSVPSWTTWTTPDPPTLVPPRITQIVWTIWSVRVSITLYGLPHLDLIITLSCHSPHVLGSPLEIQCLHHSDLWVLPPIHSSGSCTLPQLRLVPFPSTLLLVFGHCLCVILYKPRLCSTSTSVQICILSCSRLISLSLCHHLYIHVLQFHLSSWLLHSTFLSVPPKLISDLEL